MITSCERKEKLYETPSPVDRPQKSNLQFSLPFITNKLKCVGLDAPAIHRLCNCDLFIWHLCLFLHSVSRRLFPDGIWALEVGHCPQELFDLWIICFQNPNTIKNKKLLDERFYWKNSDCLLYDVPCTSSVDWQACRQIIFILLVRSGLDFVFLTYLLFFAHIFQTFLPLPWRNCGPLVAELLKKSV